MMSETTLKGQTASSRRRVYRWCGKHRRPLCGRHMKSHRYDAGALSWDGLAYIFMLLIVARIGLAAIVPTIDHASQDSCISDGSFLVEEIQSWDALYGASTGVSSPSYTQLTTPQGSDSEAEVLAWPGNSSYTYFIPTSGGAYTGPLGTDTTSPLVAGDLYVMIGGSPNATNPYSSIPTTTTGTITQVWPAPSGQTLGYLGQLQSACPTAVG